MILDDLIPKASPLEQAEEDFDTSLRLLGAGPLVTDILNRLTLQEARPKDLADLLYGSSPNNLTRTLALLQELQLVEKNEENARRVFYKATRLGVRVNSGVQEMLQAGKTWFHTNTVETFSTEELGKLVTSNEFKSHNLTIDIEDIVPKGRWSYKGGKGSAKITLGANARSIEGSALSRILSKGYLINHSALDKEA